MKKACIFAALLICTVMLAGCRKTPQEPIVRQKDENSAVSYQEAKADEKVKETQESSGEIVNELAKRLEVPSRYTASDGLEDGACQLTANAEVLVPDVEKVGIYKVSLKDMDQEMVDTVQQAFLGDAPVYDGKAYYAMTKGEIREKIEELKGYQTAGNLDPYGFLKNYEEQGIDPAELPQEEVYNLQEEIESWEEQYKEAPETTKKVKVTPTLTPFEKEEDSGDAYQFFYGVTETDNGKFVCNYAKNKAADKISFRISRIEEEKKAAYSNWTADAYDSYETEVSDGWKDTRPDKAEAEKMAGITPEEAADRGNAYVEKLGDDGWQLAANQLAVHWVELREFAAGEGMYDKAGYQLCYTRTVDGFPTGYELACGGGLESMDSTNAAMGYERLCIVVNHEGLQEVELVNWSLAEEKQTENVQMKSFPEIAAIFEQMLKVKNIEMGETMQENQYDVREVRLGYTRVYDPGTDVTKGTLIPVWDFFGVVDYTAKDENGEAHHWKNAKRYQSMMTINAIDGTIIDRNLGY